MAMTRRFEYFKEEGRKRELRGRRRIERLMEEGRKRD